MSEATIDQFDDVIEDEAPSEYTTETPAARAVVKRDIVQETGITVTCGIGPNRMLAKLAGKVRRHRIRVVLGDRVTVAVSPYDPTRGFIVYRQR